jgi:hypothetical protein
MAQYVAFDPIVTQVGVDVCLFIHLKSPLGTLSSESNSRAAPVVVDVAVESFVVVAA